MSKNKDESLQLEEKAVSRKKNPQEILEGIKKEEMKIVKGRFRHHECPGSTEVIECVKYKGVPPFKKAMTDGEVYEIPLWVARWLNGIDVTAGAAKDGGGDSCINSCALPVHKYVNPDEPNNFIFTENGVVPKISVEKWDRRRSFEPLDFSV